MKVLSISRCSNLEFLLPRLFRCHLPVLEKLKIENHILDDSYSRSLSLSLGIFPKLIDLTITGLKGLERLSISISEGDLTSLRQLYRLGIPNLQTIELGPLVLENFTISGCSKLRSLTLTHSFVEVLHSFYFIFLLNKEVLTRRFMFYFVFCVVIVLSTFGLSSFSL